MVKSWICLTICAFSMAAHSGELSKIPIRFDAALLVIPATINFEGYSSFSYSGYGLGSDFEILMPGIHSLIGISGLVSTQVHNRDHIDTLSIGSAYLGVTFKSIDLIFGPSLALVYRRLEGPQAAPDDQAEYTAKMTGGFVGLRRNFSNDSFLGLSIALKGFYLTASNYDKDLKTGSSTTETDVKKTASAYGGWLELTLAIGGKSKHNGWGWGFGGL